MSEVLQAVEIATPEAVALSVDVAGLGYRALAWLVDATLIFLGWLTLILATSYVYQFDYTRLGFIQTWLQVLMVLAFFVTNWGYAILFEAIWRGQTPGKRFLRLRVVRTDGSPATFLDLALRNLCRAIDFLPLFYGVGMVTMVITERHRRLGDLIAGTMVIHERDADLSRYEAFQLAPKDAASPAATPLGPSLNTEQLELVLEYLQRAPQLDPEPRAKLAVKLAALFQQRLPEGDRKNLLESARAEGFLRALARGEA
jgi:uncharacterized RDD family membrane protein YckC